jgi:LysR family transcriptional regulator, cyn operon transcriptional activator
VTQPTLSHQIKQLEDELGCELFDRSARTVRLTNAGQIFLEYARRTLRETEDAKLAIQEYKGLRSGSLTVGVISSFIDNLLPPLLAEFQTRYPDISLRILELPSEELQRRVRDGDLAFGIAYGPVEIDNLSLEALFKEELAVVVSRRHPLAGLAAIDFATLADTKLALLTNQYISRKIIDSAFLEAMVNPRIAVEMNSISAILETVERTMLATVLTKRRILHSRRLTSIPIRPAIVRSAALITRQNAGLSPAAKILSGMFRDAYKSVESELSPASPVTARGARALE